MAKYRKTALIEAQQLTDILTPSDAAGWYLDAVLERRVQRNYDGDFTVITAEGPLVAQVGDWVAHNPDSGDIWPIAKATFEKTYEPAE